jgi:hypothetical protein
MEHIFTSVPRTDFISIYLFIAATTSFPFAEYPSPVQSSILSPLSSYGRFPVSGSISNPAAACDFKDAM